jgi:chromosome segregation ATPase
MSTIPETVEAFRRLNRWMQDMTIAAAKLEELGSLDNQSAEIAARIEKTRGELDAALAEVAKARALAQDVTIDASRKAAALVEAADKEAAEIVAGAREDAAALKVAAETDAAAARAAAEAARAQAEDAAAVKRQIAAEVDVLTERLTEARKAAAAILG